MFSSITAGTFDDTDFKEDSVREVIITPILAKLGYMPTGDTRVIRSKTLRHPYIRVGTRNFPVTMIPDYTLLVEEKPVFVLDAKSPQENILDERHLQQVYSYAIHPEIKCQEFGLCNGRQLAVFHVDRSDPVLLLDFKEFEDRWFDIEKYLSPKYLMHTELRRFAPDFGFKLKQLGLHPDADLIMFGVRLNIFGRVSEDLYTATANCDFCDIPHCVSYDFPKSMLPDIVAGLPGPLPDLFCEALNRAPFQAAAGLVIELDLTARLGEETQGESEMFIPLVIHKIHASRFNPDIVPNDPNDIPPNVFQLRKAFNIVTRTTDVE